MLIRAFFQECQRVVLYGFALVVGLGPEFWLRDILYRRAICNS